MDVSTKLTLPVNLICRISIENHYKSGTNSIVYVADWKDLSASGTSVEEALENLRKMIEEK